MNRLLALALIAFASYVSATALDDYCHKFDPAYGYVDTGVVLTGNGLLPGESWTGYILNMTSQRWLTDDDFADNSPSKSLWWHYLVVIVPNNVKWVHNASLWITGGGTTSGFPKAKDEDVLVAATLAMFNNIVTGALFQIPNERTIFRGDPKQQSRSEDAVIAYTWQHFLNDPSKPEWLLRFPMTKAAMRAMDTITDYCAKNFALQLDHYAVAGASKRGWTTWDVGAVDGPSGRTAVIIPVVLDAINFVHTIHHQFRSYGNWSFALKDYIQLDLMQRLEDPNMPAMQGEIDPFFYRDRLTMPKLVVNAAMDEFQQPDDTMYWWDQMPEPKHFLIAPNAEHSEATGVLYIVPGISTWMQYMLNGKYAIPEFTWAIDNTTGAITATLNDQGTVEEANVWYAYSCGNNADGTKRRDFRIVMMDSPCKCGIPVKGFCASLQSFWSKKALTPTIVNGKRTYTAQMDAPTDGRWVASFIEVKYVNQYISGKKVRAPVVPQRKESRVQRLMDKLEGKSRAQDFPPIPLDLFDRLAFTSEVSVFPQTFPYADCSGKSCGGGLC